MCIAWGLLHERMNVFDIDHQVRVHMGNDEDGMGNNALLHYVYSMYTHTYVRNVLHSVVSGAWKLD